MRIFGSVTAARDGSILMGRVDAGGVSGCSSTRIVIPDIAALRSFSRVIAEDSGIVARH